MKSGRLILTAIIWLGLGLVNAHGQVLNYPLNNSDQVAVADSFQQALEYNAAGTATTWRNPDDNHSGKTVPIRTFQTGNGIYCREFQQTIIIDGQAQLGYGTACRQPDGTWQVVDPRTLRLPAKQRVKVTHVHVYEPTRYSYYNPYPYPYWFYPGYISFSFGYVKHSGHSHIGHRSHRIHRSHWGNSHRHGGHVGRHFDGGWRGGRHHR